jgi:hypothetical protein
LIVLLAAVAVLAAVFLHREYQMGRERDRWFEERRELLNRIKPETAQVPTVNQVPQLLEPVRSDEDYWEARGMDQPYIPDDVQFTPDGFPITGASPFAEPPK